MGTRDDRLTCWTIQPISVWQSLTRDQRLAVDSRYVAGLHHAYDWLRRQLQVRMPGFGPHYPWWAYCEKPDLRIHRHLQPRGQWFVRLELRIPADRVVVFPHWAWDCLFFGQYLSVRRRDAADWTRRMRRAVPDEDEWPLPHPWQEELEQSWLNLFDPDLPSRGRAWGEWRTDREAVFEFLELNDVRSVARFQGTHRRSTPRTFSVIES